jgi:hypothetical protein
MLSDGTQALSRRICILLGSRNPSQETHYFEQERQMACDLPRTRDPSWATLMWMPSSGLPRSLGYLPGGLIYFLAPSAVIAVRGFHVRSPQRTL